MLLYLGGSSIENKIRKTSALLYCYCYTLQGAQNVPFSPDCIEPQSCQVPPFFFKAEWYSLDLKKKNLSWIMVW